MLSLLMAAESHGSVKIYRPADSTATETRCNRRSKLKPCHLQWLKAALLCRNYEFLDKRSLSDLNNALMAAFARIGTITLEVLGSKTCRTLTSRDILAAMYGPPQDCKGKLGRQDKSAQMYSAFEWRLVLLARMRCARVCPSKSGGRLKTIFGIRFWTRRCDCSFVLATPMQTSVGNFSRFGGLRRHAGTGL